MAETPHFLRALGRRPLPAQIDTGGNVYRLERTFKNDFFAVTALYVLSPPLRGDSARELQHDNGAHPEALIEPGVLSARHVSTLTPAPLPGRERGSMAPLERERGSMAPLERERGSMAPPCREGGSNPAALENRAAYESRNAEARPIEKVILKVSREASLFGLPMRWVGKILAAKERAMLRQLQDLPGIPRLIGDWGPTGVIREFIEGRHLSRGMYVGDDFHPQLRGLIGEIHKRGMAYVDLEKAENVLVGEDGKPYLFDFQIAWYLPRRWGGELLPFRLFRRWLQRGDGYHLVKLQRRTRPDQLTEEALAASYRKPLILRVYRVLSYPFTWVRRRILQWIDPRRAPGERGRVMGDCP